jgi:hypothetical protein
MALSQSRRSKSPAFCLCCSNALGQLKPRVFHRAATAALTWYKQNATNLNVMETRHQKTRFWSHLTTVEEKPLQAA